jgi:hypothetical protein
MIYKNEDACDYWCPLVRAVNTVNKKKQPHNVVIEKSDEIEEEFRGRVPEMSCCIGDMCAMFRHVKPREETATEGYCGLAGRPYGL